jgi:Secretion system C-terminal sorting domain/FG-GAP-like repeat
MDNFQWAKGKRNKPVRFLKPHRFVSTLFLAFLTLKTTNAQTLQRLNIDVIANNTTLKMPFVGGLNCPQYSPVDLNNDGKQDLFIFDRSGNARLTFLNTGTGYTYAPQYTSNFPELNDWALLRDYNGDGIADIFTYNDGGVSGIRVFKGKMVNGQIAFDRLNFGTNGNVLNFPLSNGSRTNLYTNSVDIPAIDDIDGDGDLDILAFEVGGGRASYYKNTSKERNYGLDTLIFQSEDNCWGRFYDSGFQPSVKLGTKTDCATNLKGEGGVTAGLRHPGASLTTFDRDNDGDKDLLIGSISYENISELTNGGTPAQAWMSAQNNNFPTNTEEANIPSFPAAYFLDADNDGKKDVLISPSSGNFIENYSVSWFYKNTGTAQIPSFTLQQKDFLVRDMLDFGAGANPSFIDYDADGLTDMVVGNYSYFKPFETRDARLFLFKNIGTAAQPKFQLIDDNWLNFKALCSIDVVNFSPTFGDLDDDGDLDMLVGEDSGTLFFVENKAGAGKPLSMGTPQAVWKNIQAGTSCKPQIIDLNRDGLMDIVTGTRSGTLRYYQNIGSRRQPNFNADPTIAFLGKINVADLGFATGFAAPCFVDFKGKYHLFIGTENGKIQLFNNIDNNLNGSFTLLDADYGKIRDGSRTTPIVKNINADASLEMIVGNYRGGLTTFRTNLNAEGTSALQSAENQDFVRLSPNPANDFIQLDMDEVQGETTVKIVNTMGQIVKNFKTPTPPHYLDIKELHSGIYFIEIKAEGKKQVLKFFKN